MTPEQKRIALARKAGWKPCQPCLENGYKDQWRLPSDDGCAHVSELPNFTGSLDAVAALEGMLTNRDLYLFCLAEVCGIDVQHNGRSSCTVFTIAQTLLIATATALQRCDALCAVWGLDKEETK